MTSPDVLGTAGTAEPEGKTGRAGWGGRAAKAAKAGKPPKADRAAGKGEPDTSGVPTGRGIELVLLAFAAVIVTGALVLVEANQEEELTRALLYVGAAYLGLFTIAHFAVRRLAPYADPLMLPCVALLNGLGLVMIHRLDLAAQDRAVALGREAPTELIQRQVAWTAKGLGRSVGVLDYRRKVTRVSARMPTPTEAGLLQMPRNRPLLVCENVNVDLSGAIVEFGVSSYPSTRVHVVFEP